MNLFCWLKNKLEWDFFQDDNDNLWRGDLSLEELWSSSDDREKKSVSALSKEKGKVMFGSFLSFPGFPIGFPRALQDIGHKAGSKSGALPGGFQKWTTPNLGNQISSWRRNQNCCQKEISWLVQNFDIEFVLCDDGWRKEIRQQSVINSGAVMNEFWLILPSQDFHTWCF